MNEHSQKNGPPWYAWVVIGAAVLLALVLMFPGSPGALTRGTHTRIISNRHQLIIAAKIYAEDHHGNYPPRLTDLENDGALEVGGLASLMRFPPEFDPTGVGWTYIQGLNDKSPADQPVLVSPVFSNSTGPTIRQLRGMLKMPPLPYTAPKRVVAFADTSVALMKEEDFQKLLKDHHITFLPPAPATAK